MRMFLKFALKSQWKTILIILALVILQTNFQMEIISLFGDALSEVQYQEMDRLFESGLYMLLYTIISMIAIYAVSFLSNRVSSKVAFNTREKIFHILMNLPDGEIDKFKITGLVTRSTRGVYSEQGFIMLVLEHLILIPIVSIAIVYEIASIDRFYALSFAAFLIILAIILTLRLKQVTEIFFKAKATYGNLNLLFLSKINNIAAKIPIKKQESEAEFEKACANSLEKNVKYLLSQYYLGPMILWILYVIILILLVMVNSEYSFGFEPQSVVDSVIIIAYISYFFTTLLIIPTLIEMWPRSYATSVRLEEVLKLEDKVIKSKNTNDHSQRIEIVEKDINEETKGILYDIKEIMHNFYRVLDPHKRKVIISMILLMISTLCIVYAPKVAGNTVDLMMINWDSSNDYAIYTNVGLLLVLYSAGYLLRLPSLKYMGIIGEEVAYNLRRGLFDKLDTIGSSFIQNNSKGLILSRLNNDLMNVREFVSLHLSDISAQILSIALVIVLILTTDFRLSLIYLATLPVYVICFYLCDAKSRKHYDSHQMQLGRMMSYFERALTNRSSFHEKYFKNINQSVTDYYAKSRNISNVMVPVTTFLTNLSNLLVYVVGVYFLASHEIQLGTLLAVILYGQLLTKPVKKLSASLVSIETSFSSMKRIFEITEYKNEKKEDKDN